MADQNDAQLSHFGQAADLKFMLRAAGIYDTPFRATRNLKEEYSNQGIASIDKYLGKTRDAVEEQFQTIEEIFAEVYIHPFEGAPLQEITETWLRNKAKEVAERETFRALEMLRQLCSSFAGATSDRFNAHLSHVQALGKNIEGKLKTAITILTLDVKAVPTSTDAMVPRPGKKHSWLPNQWTIKRSLPEGGQGWTYLVRRSAEPDGKIYVFKRLKNQDRAGRLEAEIKALLTLSHPGILKIIESGEEKKSPYYVAEYCEKGDLSKWNPQATGLLQKLMLYRQICDAVAAAHQSGILHRDIKPPNILIRLDASVAVGDFGLCLHLTDDDDRLTAQSEAVGARNYIPPEWEDGRADDPRPSGDVYSLGKLLYFMLSGRSLSREKHRVEPHNLLLSEAARIDPGIYFVYDLLDKTIANDPRDRYQNAAELRDALDWVIMKIEKNANVLDMKVRQHCMYCISGEYRPMQGSGDQHTLSLVCSNCGNIQHFTTQYSGAKNWWMTR